MVAVKWSERAGGHLAEIFRGILKISFSEEIAHRKIDEIMATIDTLEEFPELGKRAKDNFKGDWDFGTDVRAIVSGKYWIFYDYNASEKVVEILAIFNQKRDMHRIFK